MIAGLGRAFRMGSLQQRFSTCGWQNGSLPGELSVR
jgi:hypothetical protein